MTSIILVAIGIVLAAVATLMVMFFGGGSLHHASDRANAEILENAGANVESASGLFRTMTGSPPASMSELVAGPDGQFLKAVPSIGGAATGAPEIVRDGGDVLFRVVGVDAPVCDAVDADLGIGAPPPSRGSLPRGCFRTGSSGVFFAVL